MSEMSWRIDEESRLDKRGSGSKNFHREKGKCIMDARWEREVREEVIMKGRNDGMIG